MLAVTVDMIKYCECQIYLLQGCCTGNTKEQKIAENDGLWRCCRCLVFQHHKEIANPGDLVLSDRYKAFSGGRDSSVGIATRYGLDSAGIESRWGRDFLHSYRPALGSTHPPVRWVLGLSRE